MSKIRCFRKLAKGDKRHGLFVMTKEARGAFFHGDRDEIQAPRFNVADLVRGADSIMPNEEISPQQALAELENWPAGQEQLRKIFARHIADAILADEG